MIDISKQLEKYIYIWTVEKENWVLFKYEPEHDKYDMAIYNEKTELIKMVSHPELRQALIDKMLEMGNRVIDSPFKLRKDTNGDNE